MKKQNTAVETYKYFSTLEGNKHIASEFALKKIIDIIDSNKIVNILELGLGIGSISYCVFEYSKNKSKVVNYVGTESNEFCLSVLPKYLKEHFNKVKVFDNLNSVSFETKFDLVIIDGQDESLLKIEKLISKRGIIIIEGDRIPQLQLIRNSFPNSLYVRVISNYKSPLYGPNPSTDWSGGLQLIFINPSFSQKTSFLFYKAMTSIRYKIRSFKK